MSDFLFHKVSEEEKEKIKEEAKKIMDSFSKKLSKIRGEISEPLIEREDFEREEVFSTTSPPQSPDYPPPGTTESKENKEFRKIMFENAPNKNKDFILGEKKTW